jgi:hypothetical protein
VTRFHDQRKPRLGVSGNAKLLSVALKELFSKSLFQIIVFRMIVDSDIIIPSSHHSIPTSPLHPIFAQARCISAFGMMQSAMRSSPWEANPQGSDRKARQTNSRGFGADLNGFGDCIFDLVAVVANAETILMN